VQKKVCHLSFVDEETNGSYPFAKGLNGLAHLCILHKKKVRETKRKRQRGRFHMRRDIRRRAIRGDMDKNRHWGRGRDEKHSRMDRVGGEKTREEKEIKDRGGRDKGSAPDRSLFSHLAIITSLVIHTNLLLPIISFCANAKSRPSQYCF
jgi:hypothetical protein